MAMKNPFSTKSDSHKELLHSFW